MTTNHTADLGRLDPAFAGFKLHDGCIVLPNGYRLDQYGKAIKPYLFCWYMHADLLENIRDQFGPGEYRLLNAKDAQWFLVVRLG